MRTEIKRNSIKRRKLRVRRKITGTAERPRMSVCFTGRNIYVQFIDDTCGVTIASASTRQQGVPDREGLSANIPSAKKVGVLAAEAAKSRGIEKVVFDRGGAQYHGKVQALAESAREAGLQF